MFDSLFPSHWTTLRKLMWLKLKGASAAWETITGNPVSFTALSAPLRKLSIAFSPVQDLNGYDSPWPAGGGKNILPAGEAKTVTFTGATFTSDGNGRYSIVSTDSETRTADFVLDEPIVIPSSDNYKMAFMNSGSHATALKLIFMNNSTVVETWVMNPTNRVVTTWSAMTGKTANKIRIECGTATDMTLSPMFVPQSADATTFAPFSNICPISGWDSLTVEQRGKNLFNPANVLSEMLVDSSGKLWHIVGFSTIYIPLSDNAQYTLSQTVVGSYVRYALADDLTAQSPVYNPTNNGNSYVATRPLTFTNQYHHKYLVATVYNSSDTVTLEEVLGSIQLELGNQATEYVPYNPSSRSISISLGSTVYSGWVDAVTGVGEVTMAKITRKWSEFANKNVGVTYAEGRVYLSDFDSSKRTSSICDCLKYSSDGADYGKCFYAPSSGNYFRAIVMNTVSDDDEFTFVYPLATPIPIQLTPQEINSLAGDNVMFTPCDSLTVEYRSN